MVYWWSSRFRTAWRLLKVSLKRGSAEKCIQLSRSGAVGVQHQDSIHDFTQGAAESTAEGPKEATVSCRLSKVTVACFHMASQNQSKELFEIAELYQLLVAA